MVIIWTGNLCVQLAISFSYFWTVFNIAVWYGYSFLGLELGSSFSPPLAEDLLAPAFFFLSFKEIHYFFRHCRHMARQQVCVTRRFDFSTAFTVDLLKHLWDQDRDLVLDEISNSQLFSSAYIFNSQNWISTRILRVCKHEFRALFSRKLFKYPIFAFQCSFWCVSSGSLFWQKGVKCHSSNVEMHSRCHPTSI